MKLIREYKPVAHELDFCSTQKYLYILEEYEKQELRELWDNNELEQFDIECRYALDVTDMHSRFDGDKFEVYSFYLTEKNYLTMVREWGYAV